MTISVAPQLTVMRDITGVHWAPGEGPNKTIGQWLNSIVSDDSDMSSYCRSAMHLDYFEWCGMTVAYCVAKAGFRPVFGTKETDKFLWALAWLEWGEAVQTPEPGDVVVLNFGGGHQHVTLFEGDAGDGNWNCRGGNQSHEVRISKFPRSCVSGIRRPSAALATTRAEATLSEAFGSNLAVAAPPMAAPAMAGSGATFTGGGIPLTQAGLTAAAQQLRVGVNEIWALTFTETEWPFGGFYSDKRPQILFERHIFHRLTNGRFDAAHSNISSPQPGGYGAGGAHQYDRLSLAMGLDESAALQSASWGIGQVLGENYEVAGFASVQDMVTQLFASEDRQLAAVANEIASSDAANALADHDWKTFARIYNGPNYALNNYDTTLRTWYEKISAGASPDLSVRTAQVHLMYLGYAPSDIDGVWGKHTRSAMNEYQTAKGLPITSELDDATLLAVAEDGTASPGGGLAPRGG